MPRISQRPPSRPAPPPTPPTPPPATDQHAIITNAVNPLKRSHDQISETIAEQGRRLRLAEDAVRVGDANYPAKLNAVGTQYARALEQVKVDGGSGRRHG